MKKSVHFSIAGVRFQVPFTVLTGLFGCYLLGALLSLFFPVAVSDKLFSPFVVFSSGDGAMAVFFHSFLYFVIFAVLGLVFETSYFGFAALPPLMALKGFFSALAIQSLILDAQYIDAFLLYGPLFMVETAVLLIYYSQSMLTSLRFFRGCGAENDPEGQGAFSYCLRQFSVVIGFLFLPAALCGLMQYFG